MRHPLTLLLLLSMPLAATESSAAREARFLNFSVQDRHGIWVRDLKREEVELKLAGRPVDIRYFGYRNVDTAFAVVLENSPRTAEYAVSQPQLGRVNTVDRVRYEMQDDFFDVITRIGPCMLAQFDREVESVQKFTREPDLLIGALNRIRPQPSGLMTDYIEVGRVIGRMVDVLGRRSEKRKILIVFTSIVDRSSYNNLSEYQDMLRYDDVELYVVSFAPRTVDSLGATFEQKSNALFFRRLARETAGRAYMTGEFTYLEELFTDLKGRLANYYTVGFYVEPTESVGEHEVSLQVARKKSKVTHRKVILY